LNPVETVRFTARAVIDPNKEAVAVVAAAGKAAAAAGVVAAIATGIAGGTKQHRQ
jgi:hypothetical protein